ncbi:MAG TPA: putative metal-binding motif-containing protein [Candidatus Polarisedimenticolia bacterium]|nr:putative metal-binding motif-containing protein [Candidatus Polarisedimenticolia bacterium]
MILPIQPGSSLHAADNQPPACTATVSGAGAAAVVQASATDRGSGQTGILSVVLDPLSSDLICDGCAGGPLSPAPGRISFTVRPAAYPAEGRVLVTDGAGNVCTVGASFTEVGQGPVSNQALIIDKKQSIKLYVLEGNAPEAGVAAVSTAPPSADDADCLPECFEFISESIVLTVDSPISGFTTVALDTLGNNNTKMMHRRVADGCPFSDLSQSISGLVIDPRLKGGGNWSRVQYVAARPSSTCEVRRRTDRDGDGFSIGGSTPAESLDCNDSNPSVNPNGSEVCNGIDDDCNGGIDELACGVAAIEAVINTVGAQGVINKTEPLVGAEFRLYDASPGSCAAALGNSPKNYPILYGDGSLSAPGCISETSALSDAQGRVQFPAAPGYYIAVGRPAPPFDGTTLGITIGNVSVGATSTKQIQLLVDENGEVVNSRTQR